MAERVNQHTNPIIGTNIRSKVEKGRNKKMEKGYFKEPLEISLNYPFSIFTIPETAIHFQSNS